MVEEIKSKDTEVTGGDNEISNDSKISKMNSFSDSFGSCNSAGVKAGFGLSKPNSK